MILSPIGCSKSFSSPSPSTLPSSLSSLSLRQKIKHEYLKTYSQNLLKPPLQFLSFTQNTRPKSTDPIEEKKCIKSNRYELKPNEGEDQRLQVLWQDDSYKINETHSGTKCAPQNITHSCTESTNIEK